MKSVGYKGLRVYQDVHRLAVEVHKMTLNLPRFEMYEEGSQIRRSSKSVAVNIVEGYGRRAYKADYLRFLVYAHASCGETREHLELLHDCGSLGTDTFQQLYDDFDSLGRDLFFFIDSVTKRHVTPAKAKGKDGGYVVREEETPYESLDPNLLTWLEEEREKW